MTRPVVIVGGGLAGLVCARALHRRGISFILLEATERVGGRLKTDVVDGFRLDRGFQVHFDAYPHAQRELDYGDLDLRPFKSGAYVFHGDKLNVIDPSRPLKMVLDRFLSLKDLKKLKDWRAESSGMTIRAIRMMEEATTEAHLREYGFSEDFLNKFARPFFGGIFLDRELQVSRRQFTFVFKMLSEGPASLPDEGIEAIPRQILAELPAYQVREFSPVKRLTTEGGRVTGVQLDTNEVIPASAVVLATDAETAGRLSGLATPTGSRSSVCLYFETARPVVDDAMIVLNGSGSGRVNEVAPLSNAAPGYAPAGKHLFSATILGDDGTPDEELAEEVKRELGAWFPDRGVYMARFLRAYRIRYAQMPQPPGFADRLPGNVTGAEGLYFAGEFTTNSSIDGAIESGLRCASAILSRTPAMSGA